MRREPLPPGLAGRAFLVAELRERGLSRRRTRAKDVDHPFHGVASIGAPDATIEERCRLLLPAMRPGWAFSHRTAAALWGGQLPRDDDGRLDVAVADPQTPPRRAGVAGRKVHRLEATMLRGLPVVEAADAWVLLAARLNHRDLVAVGDSLLPSARRGGATTRAELAAAVARHHHAYGIRAARAALEELRDGVESRPETLLRLLLVDAGLPEPRVAHAVAVGRGVEFHPDLAYPERRLAIEYEGDHHRTDAAQWHHDVARQQLLEDAGWRVIRVTAKMLFRSPEPLAARIRHLLTAPARA